MQRECSSNNDAMARRPYDVALLLQRRHYRWQNYCIHSCCRCAAVDRQELKAADSASATSPRLPPSPPLDQHSRRCVSCGGEINHFTRQIKIRHIYIYIYIYIYHATRVNKYTRAGGIGGRESRGLVINVAADIAEVFSAPGEITRE